MVVIFRVGLLGTGKLSWVSIAGSLVFSVGARVNLVGCDVSIDIVRLNC